MLNANKPYINNRYVDDTFLIFNCKDYGRLYPGVGRPYGGFPDFRHLGSCRLHIFSLFGTRRYNVSSAPLGSSAPGPPGYECYGQHYGSVLHQQTGRDPFPLPVTSSTVFLWLHSQNIAIRARHIAGYLSILADLAKSADILAKSADIDRVGFPSRNRIPDL